MSGPPRGAARAAERGRATWVDEELGVDSRLVSSRASDDLPAFIDGLLEEVAEVEHAGRSPDRAHHLAEFAGGAAGAASPTPYVLGRTGRTWWAHRSRSSSVGRG